MNFGFQDLKERIIDTGLCNRCGGCQASCPVNAISFTRTGLELAGECISCGNCTVVCPGGEIDLSFHEKRLFGSQRSSTFGRKLGIYIRKEYLKAGEDKVFRSGYFGGKVSALLIHALEKELIDAALLTDWSGTDELSIGRGVIARNREEVLSASSSKYVFSPVLNLLKDVRDDTGIGSAALVGLPCHIHAFRKMEIHEGTRPLTEKIRYVISLNCGTTNLTEEKWRMIIEEFTGISEKDISRFSARKISGTVIRFKVQTKLGYKLERDIKMSRYMARLATIGAWPRCMMCPDYSGELSDISFGAPYIR
jgi:coenzyme F420 hydrogenase subunit beta